MHELQEILEAPAPRAKAVIQRHARLLTPSRYFVIYGIFWFFMALVPTLVWLFYDMDPSGASRSGHGGAIGLGLLALLCSPYIGWALRRRRSMVRLLRHGEMCKGHLGTTTSPDLALEWTTRLALLVTGAWFHEGIRRVRFQAKGRRYFLRGAFDATPEEGSSVVILFRPRSRHAIVFDMHGLPVIAKVHRERPST